MLDEVLPQFGDRFKVKQTMANAPIGMIKTLKLGIHSVPALVIDDKIAFREVPTKQDLINKLKLY